MEAYQEQVLAFLKGEMGVEERKAFEESLTRSPDLRDELERSRELLELMEAANEQATAQRVDLQIRQAIEKGASDIHVIPGKQETIVYTRQNGELYELERVPKGVSQSVVDRWKVLADCDLRERQLPQEGRIRVTQSDQDFDLRVTFVPTVLGERVTVRVLFKPGEIVELDRLGLSGAQHAVVQRLLDRPNGFVLVSGRAGSGKTTTLYAMLLHLQRPERPRGNVMTVEEPVEFVLDGISQIRVNRRAGLTYAAALRAVLKSDLDVVMIGDLPDGETAELALHMAATGHLVLAQLTANYTLGGLRRLRELGVDPFLVAQHLAGGLSQRLARRVCPSCAAEYEPSPAHLERLGLTAADGPFRRGAGCEPCRKTGYRGRVPLYEQFELDDRLRELISQDRLEENVWREALATQGGTLWDDARTKVRQGLTTVEEVTRVLLDYPLPLPAAPGAASAAAANPAE
jgi:type II secretory ATPase GspE/PulE/Tfp pilus assembly ATPase PilB-like protein